MRRTLEIAAIVLLLALLSATAHAVWGPGRLPDRIPTHFNALGQPDGWGTPGMLWFMPILATILYLLMSLVARYPSAFHFPMRTLPSSRARLEQLALQMIAWLKVEVIGLFAWIQYETLQLARRGEGTISSLFLPAVLVLVFGTIAWHVLAMKRAASATV
jgi:uncharacterized membrane protein